MTMSFLMTKSPPSTASTVGTGYPTRRKYLIRSASAAHEYGVRYRRSTRSASSA